MPLAQEKQDEIIEEMLSKIKMTKLKRQMLRNTLYLGALPQMFVIMNKTNKNV